MRSSKKTVKTIIIVLAILLGLNITALAGILIYNHAAGIRSDTSLAPENIITPESEAPSDDLSSHAVPNNSVSKVPALSFNGSIPAFERLGSANGSSRPTAANEDAAVISLHSRQPEDNMPFELDNMFPGDTCTKYFCVKVSHNDDVAVKYHADIHEGCEKLAEVLMCRVYLQTTGETLYDGLMRDMPAALEHRIETEKRTESELYYEITAYLPTSVENEYQQKPLVADFRWWVEDNGSLTPPPATGGATWIYAGIAAIAAAVVIVVFLIVRRKHER